MSRRAQAPVRHILPDPKFNNLMLAKFMNVVMKSGKKSAAEHIIYGAIDRITEKGVVANGVEYEVDCIIYASGFEITSDFEKRLGIPVFGQNGTSLYDHWRDGMRTAYGVMMNGFPNLFVVGGLFCFTLSLNYSGTLEDQTAQLVKLGEAETVGAVDEDRVGAGDIEPAFDDRGRKQHLVALFVKRAHPLLDLGRAHLAVRGDEADFGDGLAQPLLDLGLAEDVRVDRAGTMKE